jgi:uncharacterized sulfatase
MRRALDAHLRDIRDVGFLPEYELQRSDGTTPYDRSQDPQRYDFERVYAVAQQASDGTVSYASLRPALADQNPIVRYWAAMGAVIRGREAVSSAVADLEKLLADPEPGPRLVAAEALGRFAPETHRQRAIEVLLNDADTDAAGLWVAQLALYTLNQFTDLTAAEKARVAALPPAAAGRGRGRGQGQAQPVRGDQRANLKAAIDADVR